MPPRPRWAPAPSTPTTCWRSGSARSIEEHFASHGERAFREAEEDAVADLLERPPAPVLSLGGGAIGSERVRGLLEPHTVVLLDVDEETAWRRAGGRRPLARDRDRFAALLTERAPLYDGLADAVLLDSARDVVRRAVPALRSLADAPAGTRLVWATAASGEYPVYVGEGLLGSGFHPVQGPAYVVTDEHVARLYGAAVPAKATVTVPAGRDRQDARHRRRRARAAGRGGAGPGRPRRGAGRRGRRRPRGLLRGRLPARRAGRAGADHAGLAGRLGVRRQDRASTCRRARTTSAPTTSRPRCWPIRRRC